MNYKPACKRIGTFFETAVKYIALVPFVLLTILTTFFQSVITFDQHEFSTVTTNGLQFIILLTMGFLCLLAACHFLKYVPETILFITLAACYLIIGIFLLTNITFERRYDSLLCYYSAWYFSQKEYVSLGLGGYLSRYPLQLGFVTYESFLMPLNDNQSFVCWINLIWIILTNLFLWLTVREIPDTSARFRKMLILLSFIFLPNIFYVFFAYGNIPGLSCLMIALYFTTRTIYRQSIPGLLLSFVFISLSCILKPNYIIGGIAIILVYLVYFLQKQKIICFIAILGSICCITLPNQLLLNHYENVADTSLSNGMPATLHIAMGLQENVEGQRAFGWYNGYNDATYDMAEYDAETASKYGIQSIEERLQFFMSDPIYTMKFFGQKMITTWCEPTFQSVWSGPLITWENNDTDNPLLYNLYSGGSAFLLLSSAMNILVSCMFLLSSIYVLWKLFWHKEALSPLDLFCMIYFIGGFLFHIMWETKSQYVYPYALFLIPLTARGICLFDLKKLLQKFKK